ncbi:MAG: ATP-grasp domain-containing protein [Lactococcus lactis]
MSIVIILNENSDKKIIENREFTTPELRLMLQSGFTSFTKEPIIYKNFSKFKENVELHKKDYIINFDFSGKNKSRNMTVPSFCDNYGIKYFNPEPYVQILYQDKFMTKKMVENFGLKTAKSILIFEEEFDKTLFNDFQFPIIVKPNFESESIGITQKSIVSNEKELEKIVMLQFKEFDSLLVEEYIDGKEIAITLYEDETFSFWGEVEYLFPELDEYNFKAYTIELKQKMPLNLKKSFFITEHDRIIIKKLYKYLSNEKLIRIDGRIKDGNFYLIEINANPGFYKNSIVPMTFELYGYSYPKMLEAIFKKKG